MKQIDIITKQKFNMIRPTGYLLFIIVFFSTVLTVFGSQQQSSDDSYELREIRIMGHKNLSENEILETLNLFKGNTYTFENLKDREKRIQDYLGEKRDFPFASVKNYQIDVDEKYVDLSIQIFEGPRTIIKKIVLSGPGKKDENDILAIIRSRKDIVFSPEVWENDLKLIAEHYEARGFPFARLTTKGLIPDFDKSDQIKTLDVEFIPVTVELEVLPGLPVHVSKVEFNGLKRTKLDLARRVAGVKENSPFEPSINENARRRLLRTGWYSDVSYPGLYREYDGTYGLLFDVVEQNTNTVSGAVGYVPDDQSDGGLAGFLDIYLSNLMGNGRKIHLNWKRESLEHESFLIDYSEPFIFSLPLEMHVHLSQSTVDSYYVSLDYGAGFNISIGDDWIVSSNFTGRTVNADTLAFGPDSSDYRLAGFFLAAEYNHLDNPFNPRKGGRYRVTLGRQWNTGGSGPTEIRKQGLKLEEYFPVTKYWTVFGGLNAYNTGTVGNEIIPVSELIRYGGAKTFRGYGEGSLLADQAGWINAELRRGIGGRSFVYLLFDLGAKNRGDETSWDTAFGTGVQLETGNNLLNIAVAIPGGEGLSAAVVHAIASAKF